MDPATSAVMILLSCSPIDALVCKPIEMPPAIFASLDQLGWRSERDWADGDKWGTCRFRVLRIPQLANIRFLNWHPVVCLGRISYSLYLLNDLWLFVAWSISAPLGVYPMYPLLTGLAVGSVVFLVTVRWLHSPSAFSSGLAIWLGRRLTLGSSTPALDHAASAVSA